MTVLAHDHIMLDNRKIDVTLIEYSVSNHDAQFKAAQKKFFLVLPSLKCHQ